MGNCNFFSMNLVFHSCLSVNVAACEREKRGQCCQLLQSYRQRKHWSCKNEQERSRKRWLFWLAEAWWLTEKLFQGMISLKINSKANCKATRLNHVFKRSLFLNILSLDLQIPLWETFSCANTDQCFREHRQVKTWKRNSLFKYLNFVSIPWQMFWFALLLD